MLIIESTKKVTVGTKAVGVEAHCRPFLMVNTSATATVYFKETADDGKVVTVDNGFALLPGQTLRVPLTARKLSIIASEADVDVRLLFGSEG
jgi:hypothetical protein